MKKILILSTISILLISCTSNSSEELIGNWKSKNGYWTARIYKQENVLMLQGGGIEYSKSKYKIINKNGDYLIDIGFMIFPITYLKESNKLLFNGTEWIRTN